MKLSRVPMNMEFPNRIGLPGRSGSLYFRINSWLKFRFSRAGSVVPNQYPWSMTVGRLNRYDWMRTWDRMAPVAACTHTSFLEAVVRTRVLSRLPDRLK